MSWHLAKMNTIWSGAAKQGSGVRERGFAGVVGYGVLQREQAASLHMVWGPSCGPWCLPWTPLETRDVLPEKGLP